MDDKGRLKLPMAFQQYLKGFPENKLFVTSLDRATARIYPISLWRENEKLMRESKMPPRQKNRVWLTAMDLGADTEVDSQGRVLLHPELRRAMGVENAGVRILSQGGRIDVMSEAVYEEKQRAAAETAAEDVAALEEFGWQ